MTGEEITAWAADSCSREPVHVIGHIQSHGLLFALSEPDLIVRQVSTNVETVAGLSPGTLFGRSFAAVLGDAPFEIFRANLADDEILLGRPLRVFVGEHAHAMNCISHRYDGVLIVELELVAGAHSLEPINLATDVALPLSRMELATDVRALSRVAASEIRRLTGFDRVMVYRFDPEWNGEVIAEVVAETGSAPVSYLGLRFPASDIPAQARRLFLVNPLRAIADVDSAPVPIVPEIGPLTGRPLDLSRSFLRSASPVHLEYLRNMNVTSSMTVSIIVGQRLWGMIACHSAAPRAIDCSTRAVCELSGRILASQVALRNDNAVLQARLISRIQLENYMAGVEASTKLFASQPFQSTRLLELFDADGLVSRVGEDVFAHGTTVEEARLLPVLAKMRTFASRGIASSNMLGILDSSAESYAPVASGALYVGLAEGSGDYLLLVRRELIETVSWAGDPDKAVSADSDGKLRPRTSFAAWRQTVRGRARAWTEPELESARFLREQLLRLRDAQRLNNR